MLKNKFGMLKVVALALTVLMLATLVACNKGMDDAAIQDAINNAVQSQSDAAAAEQSKLAASMSEAQAKADAEAKAAQESLAAAQAEAQKKIEEAEKLAAEASKAAAEAEKKAAEEASKAAESAAKAAEQAKKDAEEASKALESMQSSIAQSSKDAVTATTAPSADADAIKAIQAEFSKLKFQYTVENAGLYLANYYMELSLTFDKAAVELQNAQTKAAAESAFETLKVAVAAIENVQTRADAVQALVEDLGDIETAVFTTQVEKIVAANEALEALEKDYEKNDKLEDVVAATINTADLAKANKKLATLKDYIEDTLVTDIQILVKADRKGNYDAEDWQDNTISVELFGATYNTNYETVIEDAYYKYRLLAVINGGDVAAANAPIDWDVLVKDGKVVEAEDDERHPITNKLLDDKLDFDKPTAFYTVEELLDNYILPTLDADLDAFKAELVKMLDEKLTLNGAVLQAYAADKIVSGESADAAKFDAIIDADEMDDLFEIAVETFEADLSAISFTGDYKGNLVYAKAEEDLAKKFTAAYVDAIMEIIEVSKAYALETYTEEIYEVAVGDAEETYVEDDEASKLAAALATLSAKLDAFTANVEAAAVYDYAGIIAESVRKTNKVDNAVVEAKNFYDGAKVTATFYEYVNTVAKKSINNFAVTVASVQEGQLGDIAAVMVADLEAFRDEWTNEEGAMYDTLAQKDTTTTATPWNPDGESTTVWKKAAEVAALNEKIDAAITAIKALDPVYYTDKEINVKWADNENAGKDLKNKVLYFKEEAAKDFYELHHTEADIDATFAKTYFTATNTGLPLTYTFTADEQACEAAETLYVQAWKDIYADVVAIMGYQATYKNNITKKDTGYDKALKEAAGSEALVAEVTTFGNAYLAKIDADVAAGKYEKALGGKLHDFFVQNNYVGTNHIAITTPEDETAYGSEKFALDNIKNTLNAHVTTCNNNAANVAKLYSYKFAAVEKVAVAVNNAKYTYTTVDGATVASEVTYDYSNASATAAQKYEETITEFIAKAEAEIMAVVMKDAKTVEMKDWTGTKDLSKDQSLLDYANAVKNVDAIVNKYIGTTATTCTIDGTTYAAADSAIFQQYKMIIKNNYSGWGNLTHN